MKPVSVDSNKERWIETKVHVCKGDILDITATGSVKFQSGSGRTFGPEGNFDKNGPVVDKTQRFVVPTLTAASLLGTISPQAPRNPISSYPPPGTPFVVGKELHYTAPVEGDLYLIINDVFGFFHDNTGSFEVTITPQPSRANVGTDHDLEVGVEYLSPGGSYELEFQTDRNLTINHVDNGVKGAAVWYLQKVLGSSFNTWNVATRTAAFEKDGRLVVREGSTELWASPLSDGQAHPGARLNLSDTEGALTIVDGGKSLWSSADESLWKK